MPTPSTHLSPKGPNDGHAVVPPASSGWTPFFTVEGPTWVEITSLDAFVSIRQTRRLTTPRRSVADQRIWTLGPAGSKCQFFVDAGEHRLIEYNCTAVMSTATVSPTTGELTVATATPTLTAVLWKTRPPIVTTYLFASSDVGNGYSIWAYPPGYADEATIHLGVPALVYVGTPTMSAAVAIGGALDRLVVQPQTYIAGNTFTGAGSLALVIEWCVRGTFD